MPRARAVSYALVLVASILHVVVVVSILRQPLDVNRVPGAERSLVWHLYPDMTHRLGPAGDFFAVYAAGIQPPNKDDIYVDISPPKPCTGAPYGYPFRYLPLVSQVLGPVFRILSPRAAYVAWACVLEGVLAAVIGFFARRRAPVEARCFAAAALLVSGPYFLEVHMGQFTFFAIVLCLGGLAAFEAARTPWRRAAGGAAIAAAFLLKLFPMIVTPALVKLRGGWRLFGGVVVTAVVASALYFAAHAGSLHAFFEVNRSNMGGMDQGNHGILYVVFRITRDLGVTWGDKAWALVASGWQLAVLATTATVVFLSRKKGALFGAATLAIAFVLSYVHVWEHHYSATIVAALVLFFVFIEEDARASRRVWVATAAIILLVLPTPYVLIEPHPDPAMWDATPAWGKLAPYALPLVKVVPTVALFALALRALVAAGLERPSWRLVFRKSEPEIGAQTFGHGVADPSR